MDQEPTEPEVKRVHADESVDEPVISLTSSMNRPVPSKTLVGWGSSSECVGCGYDVDVSRELKGLLISSSSTTTTTTTTTTSLSSSSNLSLSTSSDDVLLRVVRVVSNKHTLILLDSGTVLSCGHNEYGQTGRETSLGVPRPIAALDAVVVRHVAVGDGFSVVVSSMGSVYSWGTNHFGQLGHGTRELVTRPKMVKGAITSKAVVQVACGARHTLCLCRTGELYGFGDLAIGNGDVTGSLSPSPINHIYGAPIAAIACGESHSLALTNGGVVWSWGSNAFGALGSGEGPDTVRPNVVKGLLGARCVAISCGSFHSMCLTEEGRVWAWGKASDGQLGLGSSVGTNQMTPRVVSELLGTRIVSLSCGRRFSVVLDDRGRALGMGNGGLFTSRVPTVVEALQNCSAVYAGQLANFVVFSSDASSSRQPTQEKGVFFLDEEQLATVENAPDTPVTSAALRSELVRIAEYGFSFAGSVNGSFLDRGSYFGTNSENIHGVDLDRAKKFMEKLDAIGGTQVSEALAQSWSRLIRNSLDGVSSKSAENLRVWILAFFNPHMMRPAAYHPIIDRFLVSLVGLGDRARRTLFNWLSVVPLHQFAHVVQVVQTYVAWIVTQRDVRLHSKLATAAITLGRLHDCRKDYRDDFFYNNVLSRNMDLVQQFVMYRSSTERVFNWLQYPYLLNPEAKSALVGIAFKQDMEVAARLNAFPVTLLTVRRSNLFEDTVQQLHALSDFELRRPLRVVFLGEQAVDEGGPTREMFHLLLQQILDPNYGLFTFGERSGKYWFNSAAKSGSAIQFELIGTIVGLAIANSVILSVAFPKFLYSKLLGSKESRLEHLKQIDPEVARGLEQLLSMDNVEDLGLTFSVSRDVFGEVQTYDLIVNGSQEAVTSHNVKRYVNAYLEFMLHTDVEPQFNSFMRGFQRVVRDNKIISLMNDTELQLLVEGQGNVDIKLSELRHRAMYIGYTANDPVVHQFWSVVDEFSTDLSRKFLVFVTGSPGVPISGLKGMRFIIQRSGDDPSRLPSSHTCSNVLDLPPYTSRDQLKTKLVQALEECQTFGLV